MENIKIRKAKKEDSKKIWEIRNQPISRKYSGNPEKILFKKHKPWFVKKYFSGEDNHCFILEDESDLVIGYCRLDFNDDYYVVSIALDAGFQGKGLGHYFLNEVLRQFHKEKNILAEMQKDNLPSIKLFQKNNFKIYKEDKGKYYLKFIPQK